VRRDVAGYASRPSCSTIGEVFWASINGSRPMLLQQTDCSAPRDRARHVRQGLVVEVSFEVARKYGFVKQGRAKAVVWND
jgi:hypothetical protein